MGKGRDRKQRPRKKRVRNVERASWAGLGGGVDRMGTTPAEELRSPGVKNERGSRGSPSQQQPLIKDS